LENELGGERVREKERKRERERETEREGERASWGQHCLRRPRQMAKH